MTISTVQTHCAKQSATIIKLREEAAQNKMAAESSQKDAAEQKERVMTLERELEAKRQVRLSAQEKADLSQLALQGLKDELDVSKVAHQAALAEVRSAEDRLSFMTSDEGKKEVIDSYRLRPIGKMEVTLAVKVGYDYLKAQLPEDAIPSPGLVYPPRVRGCLDMLLQLERKGAGIRLDEQKEDDDDEDEDDEDGDDDEGPGDGGDSS